MVFLLNGFPGLFLEQKIATKNIVLVSFIGRARRML